MAGTTPGRAARCRLAVCTGRIKCGWAARPRGDLPKVDRDQGSRRTGSVPVRKPATIAALTQIAGDLRAHQFERAFAGSEVGIPLRCPVDGFRCIEPRPPVEQAGRELAVDPQYLLFRRERALGL